MPTRRLTFPNAEGSMLSAHLDLPVECEPISYVVLAHCFTCSKDSHAHRSIARAMTHAGFGVLRFDFTGLGQSAGEFAATNFSSNVSDLVAAARYIGEHFAPVELLVGHSLGGAAAILAAHELDAVKAVATIGAPSEPIHVKKHLAAGLASIRESGEAEVEVAGRTFLVRQHFLDNLEIIRMREAIAGLKRALLILHAPSDETVNIENATRIFKAASHPRSFIALDQADHLLSCREDAEFAGQVIASWAQRYVSARPAADWRAKVPANRVVARTERGFRTELMANGFALYADEPADLGGTDTGPTPYDFLASGLAACTSMTLRMYADRKEWPLQGVEVTVEHSRSHNKDCEKMDPDAPHLDHFRRSLRIEGDLSDEQRQRLVEIADRCPVHRTLESTVHISTELGER
ncbi:MAG: alpha/beta fold hydrolase [Bradymonadaceae bacterium]|nr:alpha/beta fold hydrolase [Lujinxingiaceae bacterium]